MKWENIDEQHKRAKVHGGWLVKTFEDVFCNIHGPDTRPEQGYEWRVAMCFVPDLKHEWKLVK